MPVFDIHSYLGGSLVPGMAHGVAALTSAMEQRGIDRALVLSAHARSVDPLAGNRVLRAAVEQTPTLSACLVAHANRSDASTSAMREMMFTRKFAAMAIVGSRPGEAVSPFVADELLNAYRRFSKPVMLYAHDASGVESILAIAKGFPMLKVIMLGMGGADWRYAIQAAHSATNILLETSGALDRAKLPAALDVLGVHRILFGSGSPHTDAAVVIGLVEDSNVSDEAKKRILWDNAVRLLDIDEEPGPQQ